ncbi:helix-turn-helix domain-containing protein [Streptomyces sp. NPDC015127]|uniref:helix-turn-helix domain-containing protein n=1 Tax=Streptomyces sp. NPDC015127 TaxID=3364939 RepID=UPI0036FDB4E1
MADGHFSAAPHPLANPGYGKRTVSDQLPRTADDFTHLPAREAAVAAYIDRLADNSDISVKTLAKHTPYGQTAIGKALNHLIRAGHLRRGLEAVNSESGSTLWVTRTWWSRTARDDAWWAAYQRGDVPVETRRPTRSRAYILLAALGRENPVMSLSHADCAALSPLVDEWFAREATEWQVLHALTTGLPVPVHHPAALARRRLIDKLPPAPPPKPRPVRILECGECGRPTGADGLRSGTCAHCRGTRSAPPPTLPPTRVRALAAEARAAASRPPERTPS